jgi:hypothetical protein
MDDLLATIVDITMTPTQMRRQDPKTQAAVCPVCRSPHPAGDGCKPLEKSDNGYTLTRRE